MTIASCVIGGIINPKQEEHIIREVIMRVIGGLARSGDESLGTPDIRTCSRNPPSPRD